MAQKYKVFFNQNRLFISKKKPKDIVFSEIYKNPSPSDIKDLIVKLLTNDGNENYLIKTCDIKSTWQQFKLFFEVRKAAGGVVYNENGEKLFIERRGLWDLPKGHVEPGETNRDAALREVSEECGIKNIKIRKKLVKTYHTYILKKKIILKPTKWYIMDFSGDEIPQPQTEEDITQIKWVNKSLETEFVKNSFPSITEVVKTANRVVGV